MVIRNYETLKGAKNRSTARSQRHWKEKKEIQPLFFFFFSFEIQGTCMELTVTQEVMKMHRTKGRSGGRNLSGIC